MKNQRTNCLRGVLFFGVFSIFSGSLISAQAQLRRPGFAKVKREDRVTSRLSKEEGAIYLEEVMDQEVVVRIKQATAAYGDLAAKRWLGNVKANQKAVLLAVSDKAYRVRARAKQGQIAGWISKAAVEGLDPSFDENLTKFYERYVIVKELIEHEQVALGMTVDEVIASLGPPDLRSSAIEQSGRKDTFEYIPYKRVPRTVTSYDAFGFPILLTQYVEVEDGRVTIEMSDNLVSAIRESEGINFANQSAAIQIPPYVHLF